MNLDNQPQLCTHVWVFAESRTELEPGGVPGILEYSGQNEALFACHHCVEVRVVSSSELLEALIEAGILEIES